MGLLRRKPETSDNNVFNFFYFGVITTLMFVPTGVVAMS